MFTLILAVTIAATGISTTQVPGFGSLELCKIAAGQVSTDFYNTFVKDRGWVHKPQIVTSCIQIAK